MLWNEFSDSPCDALMGFECRHLHRSWIFTLYLTHIYTKIMQPRKNQKQKKKIKFEQKKNEEKIEKRAQFDIGKGC